jgi:hypothetical protein
MVTYKIGDLSQYLISIYESSRFTFEKHREIMMSKYPRNISEKIRKKLKTAKLENLF